MSTKPLFVATHPRACSTAFERVFMTRPDILHCVHEPFGDAFYFGPERLSERYEKDEAARKKSGFADVTYKNVMDELLTPVEGKRIFIKDIAHYLLPPHSQPASIASSLRDADTNGVSKPNWLSNTDGVSNTNGSSHTDGSSHTNGSSHINGVSDTNGESKLNGATPNGTSSLTNPTVVPTSLLQNFHFAFLIRHPRRAIPSYYRCTIPPLSAKTGFHSFMPSEAGYDELRRLFDYLKQQGIIGEQQQNGTGSGSGSGVRITVVDADDLLDKPAEVIRAFCEDVGIDYNDGMLKWGDEQGQKKAVDAFEKWNGFHDDAIGSTELRARVHGAKKLTVEQENEEWRQKYGEEGQRIIRETVDANIPDYEYLKSFAIKV